MAHGYSPRHCDPSGRYFTLVAMVWGWSWCAGPTTGLAGVGGAGLLAPKCAPWSRQAGRVPLAVGLAWALLPCGLLYSALMVAALAGGVLASAG